MGENKDILEYFKHIGHKQYICERNISIGSAANIT